MQGQKSGKNKEQPEAALATCALSLTIS